MERGGGGRDNALKVGCSRENFESIAFVFFQPPSNIGHAGNLPYANKTNKLRKIEYIIVKAKTNSIT